LFSNPGISAISRPPSPSYFTLCFALIFLPSLMDLDSPIESLPEMELEW